MSTERCGMAADRSGVGLFRLGKLVIFAEEKNLVNNKLFDRKL